MSPGHAIAAARALKSSLSAKAGGKWPALRANKKTHKKSKANKQKSLHSLQVGSLAPIGALKIGGMYGTLYEDGSEESFEARDYSTRDGRWE